MKVGCSVVACNIQMMLETTYVGDWVYSVSVTPSDIAKMVKK
jgi:hypothetical protein